MMQTSTAQLPANDATERWFTASLEPNIVYSGGETEFSKAESAPTVQQEVPGETMSRFRKPTRVPRVLRQSEADSMRFTLLQKWEGVVLEMDDETFTARLMDGSGKLESQQATFARSELSTDEQGQLAVGASFVWTIGYRHIGSTRHRDSTIYFRRLPAWSEDELTSARQRGEQLSTAIAWM